MPRTRSGAPIRRNSWESGKFEREWWRQLTRAEGNRIKVGVEGYVEAMRRRGEKPAIGRGAMLMLIKLIDLSVACGGALYPSYRWFRSKLDASDDSIARWSKQLQALGVAESQKRMRRATEDELEATPHLHWRQDSSVYRVALPAALAVFLPVVMNQAPVPTDEAFAREMAERVYDEQVASLSLVERVAHTAPQGSNPKLEAALANAAALIQADSENRSESPPQIHHQGRRGVGLTADNFNQWGPPSAAEGATGVETARSGPSRPIRGAPG